MSGPFGGWGLRSSDPQGFVVLSAVLNPVTGEMVAGRYEIHADDLDWMLRLHQESFELDWRIEQGAREATLR
jgi:hypothetical protein